MAGEWALVCLPMDGDAVDRDSGGWSGFAKKGGFLVRTKRDGKKGSKEASGSGPRTSAAERMANDPPSSARGHLASDARASLKGASSSSSIEAVRFADCPAHLSPIINRLCEPMDEGAGGRADRKGA